MTSVFGTLINGSGGPSVTTPDLLKDVNKPITNTDYFDIVITDLKPDTEYKIQLAWVYPDDSRSDYSSTYTFTTDPESAPDIPSQPTVTAGPGLINVTWNGNKSGGGTLQGYAKVNIYVDGVLKDFFLAAGTKSIPLAKGTYAITLRSASSTNIISNATSPAVSVTVSTDATDAESALAQLDNKITISASSIVNPTTKQLTAIDTGGITVYSGASQSTGARVVMNSLGIAGYNSSNQATFSIEASTGNALFRGNISGSSGTFGGVTINSSGISTSNNIFTLNTSGSSTIGGWTVGANVLQSEYIGLYSSSYNPGGYGAIEFFGGKDYAMFTFGNMFQLLESTVIGGVAVNRNILRTGPIVSEIVIGEATHWPVKLADGASYAYNGFGLRNIKSSTVDPSDSTDGNNGDVWLKYI